MSTAVTFNGTTYNVPATGETGWGTEVSNMLIALGNNAQTTNIQKIARRTTTSTTVTISATSDCLVSINASGACAAALPAGAAGQVFFIKDISNNAATNNITITPNGSDTIEGGATYVINTNRQAIAIVYNGTNWDVVSANIPIGTNFYKQSGNAFGAAAVLGTTDSNDQTFITNSVRKLAIDSTGQVVQVGQTAQQTSGTNVLVVGQSALKTGVTDANSQSIRVTSAAATGAPTAEILSSFRLNDNSDAYSAGRILFSKVAAENGVTVDLKARGSSSATEDNVISVNKNGVISLPKQLTAGAYKSTGSTGLISAASTKVSFDTEEFDIGNCYDNATNFRYTPTQAGKYKFNWCVQVASSTANSISIASSTLYKNGSAFKVGYRLASTGPVADTFHLCGSAIVDANGSTDYFEIFTTVNVTTGTYSILSGQSNSYFSVVKVA